MRLQRIFQGGAPLLAYLINSEGHAQALQVLDIVSNSKQDAFVWCRYLKSETQIAITKAVKLHCSFYPSSPLLPASASFLFHFTTIQTFQIVDFCRKHFALTIPIMNPNNVASSQSPSGAPARVTLHLGHLPSKKEIKATWPRTPTRVIICAFSFRTT